MGGMEGPRRRQSWPGGDVGWSQCSWQKAGVRPGVPETGAGGGRRQGSRLCRAWLVGAGLWVSSDGGARGSRLEVVGLSVHQEEDRGQPRGSDEIKEVRACSPGSGVHSHDPLIFPGEGQSRSRREKTRVIGPWLSNQASAG